MKESQQKSGVQVATTYLWPRCCEQVYLRDHDADLLIIFIVFRKRCYGLPVYE